MNLSPDSVALSFSTQYEGKLNTEKNVKISEIFDIFIKVYIRTVEIKKSGNSDINFGEVWRNKLKFLCIKQNSLF